MAPGRNPSSLSLSFEFTAFGGYKLAASSACELVASTPLVTDCGLMQISPGASEFKPLALISIVCARTVINWPLACECVLVSLRQFKAHESTFGNTFGNARSHSLALTRTRPRLGDHQPPAEVNLAPRDCCNNNNNNKEYCARRRISFSHVIKPNSIESAEAHQV